MPPRPARPARPSADAARVRAKARLDDAEDRAPEEGAGRGPHGSVGAGQLPVELRLAIGRDGLGIELARPAVMGCLEVVELVVRLPHVKFPFDVSGGVTKFRHKRGELERLAVELDARRVARWAEPRLRGLLSPGACTVSVVPRAFGALVTVNARTNVSAAAPHARLAALAFEIAVVPAQGDLSLVVHAARGAHLVEPATTLAIRALGALLGDDARREGARFVVTDAAGRLARGLLPEAGVRAPGADDVRLAGSGESDGVLFVAFVRGGSPAKVPDEATLAAETAQLTREGDDARMARDLDRARQADLVALERAPRHPEIARRIAEIDRVVGGRADAANATLRDVATPVRTGLLSGDLLAEAGDVPGAIASLLRAGEHESSNVIAALAYGRAAELARAPHDALGWLDAAVARAPRLAELRWERARRRLEGGRLTEARADFQELEALARGARDRHDVLRRAGDVYRGVGLGGDAAVLYERALLYRPDDPEALAGLGAALASEGRAARGAALLAHAIELAESRGLRTAWMLLELGRVLGERLGDRPAAVARLRDVPDDVPEAIAARGLEGRLRAQLGDPGGASLAFARLRERAGREASALAWLEEAARFEQERGDLHAAQRHLAAAISIAPGDPVLGARYRALGERIASAAGVRAPDMGEAWRRDYEERPVEIDHRVEDEETVAISGPPSAEDAHTVSLTLPEDARTISIRLAEDAHTVSLTMPEDAQTITTPEPAPEPRPEPERPPAFDLLGADDDAPSPDDAEAEARVESLTRTLQGDPNNDAVVDELVGLLTRLGRSMELLALLSARLEDAPADRREALLPKHREVLATLEREARAAGRDGEADLFKMARDAS
ncbi:MAG TPA: hypothetical protein VLT33_12455 [Labilithrix sp.]|nr:hypothetical protein [Labilithrix sp.]